jgi:hypothetical protein
LLSEECTKKRFFQVNVSSSLSKNLGKNLSKNSGKNA